MYDLVKQLKSDIDTNYNTIAAKEEALEEQISTVEVKLTEKLKQETEKAKKITDISDHIPVLTIKRDKWQTIQPIILNELSKKDLWTEVIENNDPNESYDTFYNKLYNLYNKNIYKQTY